MADEVQGLAPRQAVVINQLRARATLGEAAVAAHVERSAVYCWLRNDPKFAEAYEVATGHRTPYRRRTEILAAMERTSITARDICLRGGVANLPNQHSPIDQQRLGAIIEGQARPGRAEMKVIAAALNAEVTDLFPEATNAA